MTSLRESSTYHECWIRIASSVLHDGFPMSMLLLANEIRTHACRKAFGQSTRSAAFSTVTIDWTLTVETTLGYHLHTSISNEQNSGERRPDLPGAGIHFDERMFCTTSRPRRRSEQYVRHRRIRDMSSAWLNFSLGACTRQSVVRLTAALTVG